MEVERDLEVGKIPNYMDDYEPILARISAVGEIIKESTIRLRGGMEFNEWENFAVGDILADAAREIKEMFVDIYRDHKKREPEAEA